jgi:hypothetical protein
MRPRRKPEQQTNEYWLRKHLKRLGCSEQQIQTHLNKGIAPATNRSTARTLARITPRTSLFRYQK